MSKTAPKADRSLDDSVRAVFRRGAWIASATALLTGAVALAFPGAALTVVALIVGVYLIVSGIMRISSATSSTGLAVRWRWLLGILGVLLVAAGVLALNNPFGTILAVVIVVGLGWVVDGIGYLVAAMSTGRFRAGWPFALAGLALLAAGAIALVVPVQALGSLFFAFTVLLLVIGAVGIVALALSARRSPRTDYRP